MLTGKSSLQVPAPTSEEEKIAAPTAAEEEAAAAAPVAEEETAAAPIAEAEREDEEEVAPVEAVEAAPAEDTMMAAPANKGVSLGIGKHLKIAVSEHCLNLQAYIYRQTQKH